MSDQLGQAHPINTYPFVVVTPDGNLAVSAGRLLVSFGFSCRCLSTKNQ